MTIIREWNDPYQWQNWILTPSTMPAVANQPLSCTKQPQSQQRISIKNRQPVIFITRPIIIIRVDINQVYRSHFERVL
jgi:hypothetical protein